jgi:hypothetical protein
MSMKIRLTRMLSTLSGARALLTSAQSRIQRGDRLAGKEAQIH